MIRNQAIAKPSSKRPVSHGLDNLWRRRATEGWKRKEKPDPVPEPVEGWRRHGQNRLEAFERELAATRDLAIKLTEAMRGEPLEDAPLWHLGFLLHWRADNLGPEIAAQDRAWAEMHAWTCAFWNAEGQLRPLGWIDGETLVQNRALWREEVGLPEAAGEVF